jgi:hypothetical protein
MSDRMRLTPPLTGRLLVLCSPLVEDGVCPKVLGEFVGTSIQVGAVGEAVGDIVGWAVTVTRPSTGRLALFGELVGEGRKVIGDIVGWAVTVT